MANGADFPNADQTDAVMLPQLGLRALYALLSWAFSLLALNHTFWVAVFLMTGAIGLDYARIHPRSAIRRWLRNIAVAIVVIFGVAALLGMGGLLVADGHGRTAALMVAPAVPLLGSRTLPLSTIWILLGLVPLSVFADWMAARSRFEILAMRTFEQHYRRNLWGNQERSDDDVGAGS